MPMQKHNFILDFTCRRARITSSERQPYTELLTLVFICLYTKIPMFDFASKSACLVFKTDEQKNDNSRVYKSKSSKQSDRKS